MRLSAEVVSHRLDPHTIEAHHEDSGTGNKLVVFTGVSLKLWTVSGAGIESRFITISPCSSDPTDPGCYSLTDRGLLSLMQAEVYQDPNGGP